MRMVIDPRCGRKTRHDYAEILTYLTVAILVGRTTIRRALVWCRGHEEFLKRYMGLKNGIASLSTVSRILSGIDEEMFCLAFLEWITEILGTNGIHVAIDGKGLRGATERVKGKRTPYILNAIDTATQLVIAQLPIKEKTNEITAIPKLLELLNIDSSIVTIDAIGTNSTIMNAITAAKADYLLTVKKGNPETYAELQSMFEAISAEKKKALTADPADLAYEKQLASYEVHHTEEQNRERLEHRTLQICHNTELVSLCTKQQEIKTLGWLEQVRIPIEKDTTGNNITPDYNSFLKNGSVRKPHISSGDALTDDIHRVGIVSSRTLTAEQALKIKREHWKIENGLHYVLDQVFQEDRSSATKSKNNLALIRKFAYNLLRIALLIEKKESSPTEMSDLFRDDLTLIEKYVFRGIPRLS